MRRQTFLLALRYKSSVAGHTADQQVAFDGRSSLIVTAEVGIYNSRSSAVNILPSHQEQ